MKKILTFLILIVLCPLVFAEEIPETLNIYISEMKPCVIVEELKDGYSSAGASGFEIDLWNEIGKNLAAEGIIKKWKFTSVPWSDIEKNIKNGNADLAFSGFTIRSYRMDWADFSIPTMNSGLGIMVLKDDKTNTLFLKLGILYDALAMPVALFGLFLLLFSNIIWVAERGNDGINDKYFPGIFEAIYFCIVTCSTVGYGDYTPKKWGTKIVTMALIFCGIIAFCNFTALLSADYTTEKISGNIQSPDDLKGKIVLTQEGTTSVAYVQTLGALEVKTVDDINSACDNLLLKRGDAVVYDYPVLLNYVKENQDKVELVKGMFDKQYYGYVFPKGSNLKREVDVSLLKLYEDGTYDRLYKKWF